MDSLQRQYLSEMGIDVYSLRPDKPLEVMADVHSDVESVDQIAATAETTTNEPAASKSGFDNLRDQLRATLSTSGESKTPAASNKETAKVKDLEPQVDVETPKVEVEEADDLNFYFHFLDYENISFMVSVNPSVTELPAEYRQLCDGIMFSLLKQQKVPSVRDLRWPMLAASHIKQTEDDAKQIVSGMIKQSRHHLLLFGEMVGEYRSEKTEGTYLVLEELSHYLKNPGSKAKLWSQIKALKKSL